MKKLTLCPQAYHGTKMLVVPCEQCSSGWNGKKCLIPSGVENWDKYSDNIPDCPIAGICQHQVQRRKPCPVRQKGMVCQSALEYADLPQEDPRWEQPFIDI